jgi:hypothetical protein
MKKIDFTIEYLESLPKTIELGMKNGSKYFYDSTLCKDGHIGPKIVNINRCFLCKREETKISAEKRRKKLGMQIQNNAKPLISGEVFEQLTATGNFKSELTENRINNRKIFFHEVICDCKKRYWITSYNWGKSSKCSACNLKSMQLENISHGMSETIEGQLFYSAKKRAKKTKIDFSIQIEDIHIPEICPILDILIDREMGVSPDRKPRFNAPSIDRINSALGYVKGNIIIMSYKANVLKKDGSSGEHIKIAVFMEKMGILKQE